MREITLVMAVGLAMALSGHRVDAGPVLDGVKARGQVVCGLDAQTAGFMQIDRQGKWAGLAVDICRAVSLAAAKDYAVLAQAVSKEPFSQACGRATINLPTSCAGRCSP